MRDKDTIFSLSKEEQLLLQDVSFFKAKSSLSEHITAIFRGMEEQLQLIAEAYSHILPPAALQKRGKISKGENYLGLPYLVLDHPAVFEKDGVLAFRTMMWWGHPFTVTFHISGKYLAKLNSGFTGRLHSMNGRPTLVCIHEEQWIHHTGETNFITFEKFNLDNPDWNQFASSRNFLKAAVQVPIEEVELLNETAVNFMRGILDQLH